MCAAGVEEPIKELLVEVAERLTKHIEEVMHKKMIELMSEIDAKIDSIKKTSSV